MIGQKIAGRYTLEKNLGSGEIGVVYSAVHDDGVRRVAVKVLHPDVAETFGEDLLRWGKRAAQIRHARIANILAANRLEDGTTYFITEFVQGQTLMARLKSQGPLSSLDVADILFQLCSALAPIHRAGRPHANLKPENVFLSPGENGGSFVKIVDVGSPVIFGAHHLAGERQIVGSPKYFSPEQATGESVGLASDQFALGVTGYLLLTGALPFFGATPDQLLSAIINVEPKPITERTPSVDPALATIILTCLAKKPADRYDGLRALAVDLAAFIKEARNRPAESVDMPSMDSDRTQAVDLQSLLERAAEDVSQDGDSTVMFKADAPSPDAGSAPPPPMPEFVVDESVNSPVNPAPTAAERSIPQPLASTGELGRSEIQAAMAASMKDLDQTFEEGARSGASNADDSGGFDLAAAMAAAVEDVDDDSIGGSPLSQIMEELDVDEEPAPVMARTSGSLLPDDLLSGLDDGNIAELSAPTGAEPVQMATVQSAPIATVEDFGEVENISEREKKKRLARMTNALPRTGGLRRPYFVLFLLGLLAASVFVATTILEDEARMEEEAARVEGEKFKQKEEKVKASRLSVRLDTQPSGAFIFENSKPLFRHGKNTGARRAITPYTFSFDKGRTQEFTLRFELDGYRTGEFSFNPKELNFDAEGKLKPIVVTLTPKSTESASDAGVVDGTARETADTVNDSAKPQDSQLKAVPTPSPAVTPKKTVRTRSEQPKKRPKARNTTPKKKRAVKRAPKPKKKVVSEEDTDNPYE